MTCYDVACNIISAKPYSQVVRMVQEVVVGSRGPRQTNQPDYEFLLDVLTDVETARPLVVANGAIGDQLGDGPVVRGGGRDDGAAASALPRYAPPRAPWVRRAALLAERQLRVTAREPALMLSHLAGPAPLTLPASWDDT